MSKSPMKRPSAQRPWLRSVHPDESLTPESGPRELSDEEIIEAVLDGDMRVAGAIHDRLIGVIDHSLFRVMGRREHDHDDLVQNCFEQVLKTLTKFTYARGCSLRTWASRISTNVALNALRSRQRERKVIHRSPEEVTHSPHFLAEGQAEAHVDLEKVRGELANMRPARAEVLILHDVHGYSLGEIAGLLSVSVSAAQSRLVRGRAELKKRIDAEKKRPLWRQL